LNPQERASTESNGASASRDQDPTFIDMW
jgi:hypothetical protein